MSTTVKVTGLKELAHALRELPKVIAAKRLRGPVAQAAMTMRDRAKVLAPMYHGRVSEGHAPPGTLKKSIIVKHIGVGTSQRAVYIMTVRHGRKFMHVGKKGVNKDAYYWWFVENGTVKMQKQPYLRPAFEEYKDAAFRMIVSGLELAVEEEAEKLGAAGRAVARTAQHA
jgi:HK97 gp10 family phage protein